MRPLISDIKDYGDEPIQLIFVAADKCQPQLLAQVRKAANRPVRRPFSISELARQVRGNKRGIGLAVRAWNQVMQQLAAGAFPIDLPAAVVERYLHDVLGAQFEEKMPLDRHYNNVDDYTIQRRLDDMRPFIGQEIIQLSRRIVKAGSVRKLRRSNRRKAVIRLDDSLVSD